jgi:hypothetical protein
MPFATPSDGDVVAAGFAAWIANGIDPIEFDGLPDVEYTTATEWPIYVGPDIPPSPDQVIVITPADAIRVRGTILQSLQIRLRGLAREDAWQVRACAQAIIDYCTPNGFPRGHVNMGAFRAGTVMIRSRMPIPVDGQKRPGMTVNLDIRYRKPLPLDGAPPFLPMPEPSVDLSALQEHIADETPHPIYDDTTDLVAEVEEEYP